MCRNRWAREPQLVKPVRFRAHVPQLLSPRAKTTEAHSPKVRALQQEKPLQWESLCITTKSSPRSPKLEKACTQQRTPNAAKKLKKKTKKQKGLGKSQSDV